jgi:GNAT superfamily N-acetyltransferase
MDYHCIETNTPWLRRKFIALPWKIYEKNMNWVPPLKVEMRRKLNPRKNPFFQYGKASLFGVLDDNRELVGRGAAILNPVHNRLYRDKAGFFGWFECIDSAAAARTLMTGITGELKKNNCTHIIGPVNFTTNDESGMLIEGFETSPMIMTGYNPPYYPGLMEACGFEKVMDMLNYEWIFGHTYPEKFNRLIEKLTRNNEILLRPFDRKHFHREILTIREVYNSSFKDVWGFVPISAAEAEEMGRSFKLFSDDDLVLFAEYKGKTIGLCLSLPDVNEILKHLNGRLFPFGIFTFFMHRRRIRSVRVMVLCVMPEYRKTGAAALIIDHLHRVGTPHNYKRAELGVVMESNRRMRGLLDTLGFRTVKRYRLYQAKIKD